LRLTELRIDGLAWRRPMVARYRKDAYLSPTAKLFLDTLKARGNEISGRIASLRLTSSKPPCG
jgi:hypothetical protein